MKRAEEWYRVYNEQKSDARYQHKPRTLRASDGTLFKAIQLDAWKQGMTDAAEIVKEWRDCYSKVESGWCYSDQNRKNILNSRDKKKEI